MDQRNGQIFGLFLGILATLLVSLILFWIINLPTWAEYAIIIVLGLVFGGLGLVIGKSLLSKALPPLPDIQQSSEPPAQESVMTNQTQQPQQQGQHKVPSQQINP